MKLSYTTVLLFILAGLFHCASAQVDKGKTDVWDFSSPEGWRCWWDNSQRGKKIFQVKTTDEGYRIDVSEAFEDKIPVYKSGEKQRYENVEKIILEIEVLSGEPHVDLIMRDDEEERFMFEGPPLSRGINHLEWDVSPEMKSHYSNKESIKNNRIDGSLRIKDISLKSSGPCSLVFRKCSMILPLNIENALNIRLDTGEEFFIIRPGKEDSFQLKVDSVFSEPITARLRYGIRRRSNHPVSYPETMTITLKAEGETSIPIPLQGELGIGYLDWVLSVNDEALKNTASFAYMEPVGPTPFPVGRDEFVFGNSGTRGNKEEVGLKMRAAGLIGVKSMRAGASWNKIQPKEDVWDWTETDTVYEAAKKQGMELQFLVSYGGALWTKSEATIARGKKAEGDNWKKIQWRYPPRVEPWRKFVSEVAKRYKGKVQYYEIWNEPDLPFFKGSAEQYFELMKTAYIEIKAVDPDAIVMTGGFGTIKHPHNNPKVLDLVLKEGQDYFDYLAYHKHSKFLGLRDEVENYLFPEMKKYGADQPLYINESAASRSFEREFDHANIYTQKLTYIWSIGAKGYHWFTLSNPKSRGSSAYGYGMFREGYQPRPGYVAFNTAARMLLYRSYSHELDFGKGRWGYAFRGKGTFTGASDKDWVLCGWKTDAELSNDTFVVEVGDGARATLTDMMGNSRSIPVSDGICFFPNTEDSLYLQIENASVTPKIRGTFIRSLEQQAVAVISRQAKFVNFEIRNPLAKRSSFSLNFEPEGNFEVLASEDIELELNPNEKKILSVEIVDSSNADDMDSGVIAMNARIGNSKAAVKCEIPVQVAISRGKVSLPEAGDLVNNMDVLPDTKHLCWQGDGDLSAKAEFSLKGDMLKAVFDVNDDIHLQPHTASKIWQGDCIQFALNSVNGNGHWEIGLAVDNNMNPLTHIWRRPKGLSGFDPGAEFAAEKTESGILYTVLLPLEKLGISRDDFRSGVRMTFLVSDLDEGIEREGFIRLSEGIDRDKRIENFPVFVFN